MSDNNKLVKYKRPPLKRDAKIVGGSLVAGYLVAKFGLLAPLLGWAIVPAAVVGGVVVTWKLVKKK